MDGHGDVPAPAAGGAPAPAGLSLAEAIAHVTTTDPRFAVTEAEIRGQRFRVFADAPATLRDLLRRSRAAHGDGPYLSFEDEHWSYAAFCADVDRLGRALTGALGVRPGDRVAIAMRNWPELLLAIEAIAAVGAVTVFVNAWWTSEELEYAFEDSGARLVFADGPRLERIRPFAARLGLRAVAVRDAVAEGETETGCAALMAAAAAIPAAPEAPIHPDDDFAVMYSSGSTGHPKGVVLTHRGAVSAVWTWLMGLRLAQLMAPEPPAEAPPPQSILVASPLFHVTATHPMFLLSQPAGARIVLMRKWDPDEAVRLIERERITRFLGVPTMSEDLRAAAARAGTSLPTLSYLGAGGAKRPAAQVAELAAAFPAAAVTTGWGMTETNALGIGLSGPEYLANPGAAGRLMPPLQDLMIADEAGRPLPPGALGEIAIRSPANMRGYLNKPEATAQALRDGWLYTGDLGVIDEGGIVTIVDRKKNIIIRGGENIACLDVEGALHRHPAVVEACAFPVPDDRLGEIVGAAVQLRAGAGADPAADAEALRAFLAAHVARFKIPERLWLFEAPLIRGATDKIDRRAIRAACLARPEAAQ